MSKRALACVWWGMRISVIVAYSRDCANVGPFTLPMHKAR
jgi:hypothetical protein